MRKCPRKFNYFVKHNHDSQRWIHADLNWKESCNLSATHTEKKRKRESKRLNMWMNNIASEGPFNQSTIGFNLTEESLHMQNTFGSCTLAQCEKIDLDRLSLLDFHSSIFVSIPSFGFSFRMKPKTLLRIICATQFTTIHSIFDADLFNRCSLWCSSSFVNCSKVFVRHMAFEISQYRIHRLALY